MSNYKRVKELVYLMANWKACHDALNCRLEAFELYHTLTLKQQERIRNYIESMSKTYNQNLDDILAFIEQGC